MDKPTKLMRYNKLNVLMCRPGRGGSNMPVSIRYCSREGEIIEADNVVCTSVDTAKKSRRVRFMNTAEKQADGSYHNAQTRTLRDCLILQVNEYKIVKS